MGQGWSPAFISADFLVQLNQTPTIHPDHPHHFCTLTRPSNWLPFLPFSLIFPFSCDSQCMQPRATHVVFCMSGAFAQGSLCSFVLVVHTLRENDSSQFASSSFSSPFCHFLIVCISFTHLPPNIKTPIEQTHLVASILYRKCL